nr:unnamed protein product [Callosobruchus analis]
MDLNIEISVPRLAHKQTHRSNPPSDNDNEYWRRSLIIPYIDSLISSLNIRFSQENTPAFALSRLHPYLHKNAESFQEFYNLDITGELNLWHNLWVTKALSDDQLKDIEVVDLFKEANIFYPAVRKALIILSTIPCTTATVERSFSTLRRVKTWLRSTMGEERLTVNQQSVSRMGKNVNFVQNTYNSGNRGTILTWILSFVRNRKMVVKVKDTISNEYSLKSNVPQGSILGPLIFLLDINHVPSYLPDVYVTLFADDTSAVASAPNSVDLSRKNVLASLIKQDA